MCDLVPMDVLGTSVHISEFLVGTYIVQNLCNFASRFQRARLKFYLHSGNPMEAKTTATTTTTTTTTITASRTTTESERQINTAEV
jgi:hypothetical protein